MYCGTYGGTFINGMAPSGTEPCAGDGSPRTVGPCGPAPTLPEPVTACCQAMADSCHDITTSDNTELTNWYSRCANQMYPSMRILVGTCGADGHCIPAH